MVDILYFICFIILAVSCANVIGLLLFGYRKHLHDMEQRAGQHVLIVTAHPDDEAMYVSNTKVGFSDPRSRV